MPVPVDDWSRRRPERLVEHERLARLLSADDRAWLARMADVLPGGWLVPGMALPARGGVVGDRSWPGGVRVVVAPSGPGAASRPTRPSPTRGVLR